MKTEKDYCCSSFLAFRYVFDTNKQFSDNLKRQIFVNDSNKEIVNNEFDLDICLKKQFKALKGKKLGLLLSGGMDSAILASYMPGCDAYTFRFLNGKYQQEELKRAESFAKFYNLNLHYVDINWNIVKNSLDILMKYKGAPVHSIEPQIYEAAIQAKKDNIEIMIIGDGSDYVFGGMDGLLSKDWDFDDFYNRYIYINPKLVLNNPVDMKPILEKYRLPNNKIDFQSIIEEMSTIESYSSYANAFHAANLSYIDPYSTLKMRKPLDLERIRTGDSKYIVRNLFKIKYPAFKTPNKTPMPRPVDIYFKNWKGPLRKEFRKDINMKNLTGNQKWLLFSLEYFLNLLLSL